MGDSTILLTSLHIIMIAEVTESHAMYFTVSAFQETIKSQIKS